MLTDERLTEIKAFIVVKINESGDGMWETHNPTERLRWKALHDAYLDIYKRIFGEVYYER